MSALAIILHLLAAIVWVGGMFFVHMCVRPSLTVLAPAERLRLMNLVLGRFLPLAVGSVAVLLASGYWLLFGAFGGFAGAPVYVHVMHLTGWAMFLILFHVFFVPWRRFRRAVEGQQLEAAAKALAQIRFLVTVNLALGVITSAVGTGRYWLV
jgi:uncharacterized membrane protein